jgi:hypothetical protein
MKPSKDTQQPNQTPFEKAEKAVKNRNMLLVAYALTLRTIGESIKVSGIIDKHASDVLAAIAQETESRLGISA